MIDGYWNEKRLALAIICIALHVGVLFNVWRCNQLTPRIIVVKSDAFCGVHR